MKKILVVFNVLIIAIAFNFCAVNIVFAQTAMPKFNIDTTNQLIHYTEVVRLENTTASTFYKRAMSWVKANFPNMKDVYKPELSDSNTIVLKPIIETYGQKNGIKVLTARVRYTITITCKDDRYKYKITQFNVLGDVAQPLERWTKIPKEHPQKEQLYYNLKQVDDQIKKYIASLKVAMAKAENAKAEEW